MPGVGAVASGDHGHSVQVTWAGEEGGKGTDSFPSVWLRDNCQCPVCFNTSSSSRQLLMKDLDPEVKVTDVKVSSGNQGHVDFGSH